MYMITLLRQFSTVVSATLSSSCSALE